MVRQARIARGMGQKKVAAAIGRSPGFISLFEAGKTLAGYQTCRSLAALLGLPFTELWAAVESARRERFEVRDRTESAKYVFAADSRRRAEALLSQALEAYRNGKFGEAEALQQRAALLTDEHSDRALNAEARHQLGRSLMRQGRYREAEEMFARNFAAFRELGDPRGMRKSMNNLGWAARMQNCLAIADERFREALRIAVDIGDAEGIALAHFNLGLVAQGDGRPRDAQGYLEKAMTYYQRTGDREQQADVELNLGRVALGHGDVASARDAMRRSLATVRELVVEQAYAYTLENLAELALHEAQYERAATLFGAADRIRENNGTPVPPVQVERLVAQLSMLRRQLGSAFHLAWRAGRNMAPDAAISYALDDHCSS